MKALGALDAWEGKEAELQNKKPSEIRRLWAEAQTQPQADAPAATEGAPIVDTGTET